MHPFYQREKIFPCQALLVEPPSPHRKGVVRILGSLGTYKTSMSWPPLDLMIIDGLLNKEGINSFIFDANATGGSWSDILAMVKKMRAQEN